MYADGEIGFYRKRKFLKHFRAHGSESARTNIVKLSRYKQARSHSASFMALIA
jgi:hypothetical protein